MASKNPAIEYQESIFSLLSKDPRNTMYSLAFRSIPVFRRFEEETKNKNTAELYAESTPSYGWVIDTLTTLCVNKLFHDNFDIEDIKKDLNGLIEYLINLKKQSKYDGLDWDPVCKETLEKRLKFKYNLNLIKIPEELPNAWQPIIAPLLWYFLHVLATEPTESLHLLLSYLHLFLGCLECSQHYYSYGRLCYEKWYEKYGLKHIDLFLIRLHNKISKHGEVIRLPTDFNLTLTMPEKKYLEKYRKVFKTIQSIRKI